MTSGPTAGEVPKAGGAPGVVGVAGFWARLAVEAEAAASMASVLWVRNSLRDFDICPSGQIVPGVRRRKEWISLRQAGGRSPIWLMLEMESEDCTGHKKNKTAESGNHSKDMVSGPAIAKLLPVCR